MRMGEKKSILLNYFSNVLLEVNLEFFVEC